MEQITELNTNVSIPSYKVNSRMTVREFLRKINLEDNFFAVLINGYKSSPDDVISERDEVMILPKIAGGSQ